MSADLQQRPSWLPKDTGQCLKTLLARLYAAAMRTNPGEYIKYHSSPQAISAKVNSFLGYADKLPSAGRILDWGCQHAPDACMARASLGDGV